MFTTLTTQLRSRVETVKRVLTTNDLLRSLLYSSAGQANSQNAQMLTAMIPAEILPSKPQWQIHDHCAAFTGLYASYEQFIEDMVSDYLQLLPDLYTTYADLPRNIQTQHRVGIGQILIKLGSGQYKELEEHVVLNHLTHCVPGDSAYELMADAFLVDRQNFRFDMLVRLLTSLGVEDAGGAILRNGELQDYLKARRGDGANVQKELDDFIRFRNEAAHTSVENILATEEIRIIADFIMVLCECLSDTVGAAVIRRRMALGHYLSIGTVTETHYSGRVVIVKTEEADISTGDQVIVLRKDDCFLAEIESIRVDDSAVATTRATKGQEIGLGLSRKAKNASALRRLNPPNPTDPLTGVPIQEMLVLPLASGSAESSEIAEEQTEDAADPTPDEA